MDVAALVLGIVGLVLSFVPCLWFVALLITIPGLVLGLIARKNFKEKGIGNNGFAVAGFVTSIIGIVISVIWIILMVIGATAAHL